jgi:spore maturation protein CgeB
MFTNKNDTNLSQLYFFKKCLCDNMHIGFYLKWPKYSLNSNETNVLGDELWGESLCRSIKRLNKNIECEVYAPNFLPEKKLDYLIYLNDTAPIEKIANKHILYLQNGYGTEANELVKKSIELDYDAYVFFSRKLQSIFESYLTPKRSLFLPFGVDTSFFYPREYDERYGFECAYVGNDIKGEDATMKYLYPATQFKFGLYGNWELKWHRKYFWKNFQKLPIYKKAFSKISRGKIPQDEVPVLYSSSAINLNCTLPACIEWDVISLRIYEVLACKGFLITDEIPFAKQYMKDYLVFTTGGSDLVEKIKYYLNNKKLRDEIAESGYRYVIENASIDSRAKTLIDFIEGN